jgi:hypothetical protein
MRNEQWGVGGPSGALLFNFALCGCLGGCCPFAVGGSPAGKTKVLPPLLAYCGNYWGSQRAALFIYTLRVLFLVAPVPPYKR